MTKKFCDVCDSYIDHSGIVTIQITERAKGEQFDLCATCMNSLVMDFLKANLPKEEVGHPSDNWEDAI